MIKGLILYVAACLVVYLLWLGSDLAKSDEREHWDDVE